MPNAFAMAAFDPSASKACAVEMICGLSSMDETIFAEPSLHYISQARNQTCAVDELATTPGRLKAAMTASGVTIATLASWCGVSHTAARKWIVGESHSPTAIHLFVLADRLGVSARSPSEYASLSTPNTRRSTQPCARTMHLGGAAP